MRFLIQVLRALGVAIVMSAAWLIAISVIFGPTPISSYYLWAAVLFYMPLYALVVALATASVVFIASAVSKRNIGVALRMVLGLVCAFGLALIYEWHEQKEYTTSAIAGIPWFNLLAYALLVGPLTGLAVGRQRNVLTTDRDAE